MNLTRIDEAIDAHEYPATTEEIVDAYGDRRIELANGEEFLGDVLARLGSERYETAADVTEALRGAVGHEAVGRRYYSDRGGDSVAERGQTPLSF